MKERNVMLVLFSIMIWILVAVITLVITSLIIVTFPVCLLDKKRAFAHWLGSLWARSIVALNPFWDVTVIGRENIGDNKNYIMVSNHQSMGDILVVYSIAKNFKWIAKQSIFMVPMLGWAMHCCGYISLKRGKHGSIRDSFNDACAWLKRGVSVLIFPEGTRSPDGTMRAFKNGAFKMARETGVDILPMVIVGTSEALSKGHWIMSHKVRMTLKILSPVFTAEYTDFNQLKDTVRDRIAKELG